MFEAINQINENVNSIKLTNYQSYSLLLIFSSPTTELALEYINSSEKLIEATAFLKKMNLINYSPNGYNINNNGKKVLEFNGFIDQNENLLAKGKQLLSVKASALK